MSTPVDDHIEVLRGYMRSLEGDVREVAEGEYGVTLDAAGWPLHVGVALREGLLRAQAEVLGAGRLAPETLLRWNRGLPLVCFSHTRAGEVWVEGTLPPAAIDAAMLDRFLGLLVRVAAQAREAAAGGAGEGAGQAAPRARSR